MTNMNIGVFGDPGTGKTQVCLALLYQLHHGSVSAQGHGLSGLVLDPKNDYGRPERRAFQEALGARVVEPLHIPIDVIGLRAGMTRVEERQRIQTFVDLVSTVMGKGVGQVQRELLFTVIDALVQRHHRSPTLVEVRDAYRNAKNNKADVVSSLLGDFVNNEVFVSDPSKFVPMSDLISKELLIVNLKSLQTRADLLKQVMAIFVNQYFDAMLQMPIPGFRRGTDGLELRQLKSVLLIDEAHLVMRLRFQQLEDILLQGREIGISVILSSQFPDHFMNADMNYAMSLRTWFMHRVPALSASDLRRLGIAKDVEATSARILGLGKYESFFSSTNWYPIAIDTAPGLPPNDGASDERQRNHGS
jgi:RecA/RadA recombinase